MPGKNDAVKAAGFFRKYRDAVLFNRNLIISGASGFFASAYVSQLYAEHGSSDFANSAAALAVEYAVYIPVFATLFYVDNRKNTSTLPPAGATRAACGRTLKSSLPRFQSPR